MKTRRCLHIQLFNKSLIWLFAHYNLGPKRAHQIVPKQCKQTQAVNLEQVAEVELFCSTTVSFHKTEVRDHRQRLKVSLSLDSQHHPAIYWAK